MTFSKAHHRLFGYQWMTPRKESYKYIAFGRHTGTNGDAWPTKWSKR